MRNVLLLSIACLVMYVKTSAQSPVLKINDKDDPSVYLSKLTVEVKVTGNIAVTTMEMTFHNNNNRLLEGELVFPLPEGTSVSRYAIDINGLMREAVPVEKTKATEIFETIERRQVDPGLLERTEGNIFRTRIYPIPANGNRTVIIGYEEELNVNNNQSLRYHLPLDYKRAIDQFQLTINVLQAAIKPELEEDPDADLSFKEWGHNYTASISKENFTPQRSLTIALPKLPGNTEALMQKTGANYYFLVNCFPKKEIREKPIPGNIGIVWDVSLSGLNRDTKKEWQLLEHYLQKKGNLTVHLFVLNNTFKKAGDYTIVNGNCNELKEKIGQLQYDGGTDYSKLKFEEGEEYLFFTDGMSSLGAPEINLPAKPVYTITSSPRSDFSYLQYLAQETGGRFINMNQLQASDAETLLTQQPLQFIGIKPGSPVSETYPSIPTPITNNFSVAGICPQPQATVTLQFGYGTTVTEEKTIQLDFKQQSAEQVNLSRTWAQKKIAELDIQYENNKALITQLGKQFSIVTRNTSLIVLETVQDYVRYEIEPPTDLRQQYDMLIKQHLVLLQSQQHAAMSNALQQLDNLAMWWDVNYKPQPVINPDFGKHDIILRNDNSIEAGIITGRIMDEHRDPLSGATITLKGTRQVTVSDQNGYFSIRKLAGEKKKLIIAYVGYEMKEVNIGNNNSVSIRLRAASLELDEVVVVGYGTERRSDVTGSVSSVSPNNLEAVASTDADKFDGRISRKTSGAPGNGMQVTLGSGYFYNERQMPLTAADAENNQPTGTVEIKQWTPDRTYLQAIAKEKAATRYERYLALRQDYLYTPTFYYDMAGFFFQQQDTATGLQVLTNMAETDVENHELYKLLGYKLREIGNYEAALYIFKKVLDWRPQEPQSYRDYGLALADAGYYQRALDTFNTALNKNYDESTASLYPGFEEIIVTEMNQLIALHKAKLNLSKTDNKLIHAMPVDIRVVLNWNKSNTDIDLWVIDPNDEKCYYGHKQTSIGGRLSNDFTRGFGPEQFMLKKAIPGKYKVEVNYFGDRQFTISGPTTVMAEIFMHYADGQQVRKMITLQMEKVNNGSGILVGEFTFNP